MNHQVTFKKNYEYILTYCLVHIPNDIGIILIVESLQPYMTHSDPIIRGKGKTSIFKLNIYSLIHFKIGWINNLPY